MFSFRIINLIGAHKWGIAMCYFNEWKNVESRVILTDTKTNMRIQNEGEAEFYIYYILRYYILQPRYLSFHEDTYVFHA